MCYICMKPQTFQTNVIIIKIIIIFHTRKPWGIPLTSIEFSQMFPTFFSSSYILFFIYFQQQQQNRIKHKNLSLMKLELKIKWFFSHKSFHVIINNIKKKLLKYHRIIMKNCEKSKQQKKIQLKKEIWNFFNQL